MTGLEQKLAALRVKNTRLREALNDIVQLGDKTLIHAEPWRLSDMGHAYSTGANRAFGQTADIARAALKDDAS